MSTEKRTRKFYVIGGPVQPDRPCYVVRDADARFYSRLCEGEYCHVLAPRHTGKTSLMAYTANRLREQGIRVAIVDLGQIGGREESTDVGRWYYSFAYRIVRALRIRSHMQVWWQERSGLPNLQRLREFFLEVVLAGTEGPVVIFLDRIEAASGKAFKREIFGALRSCYDARATEPDYRRLSFAMLGVATAREALSKGRDSPLDIGVAIPLRDFRWTELRQLAAGLGCDRESAAQVSERVWHWSGGHPYLSQKIFRGLAKKQQGGFSDAVVDELVETLFLTRNAIREETHLSQIARQVLGEPAGRTQRLSVYGRVRKGAEVTVDRSSRPHRELLDSGIVVEGTDRNLAVRNPIYAQAFTARWANQNLPFEWKGPALTAMMVALLVGTLFWYSQILPRPYIRALTQPDQNYAAAVEAHRRLHFFPGYREQADRLLTAYLIRQSRRTTHLLEAERIGDRLIEIPGNEGQAAALMAEFWDRRADRAAFAGDRDAALLYRLKALGEPQTERKKRLAELIGGDDPNLIGTIRPLAPLVSLELAPRSGLLTALDAHHRVEQWQVDNGPPILVQRTELAAEVLVPVQRRLIYRGTGAGHHLTLIVVVDHARASDIDVTLKAPSGKQVSLKLADDAAVAGRAGEYRFDSGDIPELAALLEEKVAGTWTAYFTDHRQSVAGELVDWSVRIDDVPAEYPQGVSVERIPIPDPQASARAVSVLAPGGRRALSWPAEPEVPGNILVWDLSRRDVLVHIPRPAGFATARFVLGQAGVLVSGTGGLDLWDAGRGNLIGHLPFEPAPGTGIHLSGNGRFLVVDTHRNAAGNVLTVWDLQRFAPVGQLVTGELMDLVATDPRGRYIAVSDGDRLVRLWAVRDGTLLAEIELGARPIVVQFDPTGRWLLTQDAAYRLQLWDPRAPAAPVLTRSASSEWQAAFAPAGDEAMFGSVSHGFEVIDLERGVRLGMPFRHGTPVRTDAAGRSSERAHLSSSLGVAVTYDGQSAIRVWKSPQVGPPDPDEPVHLVRNAGTAAAVSADGRQMAFGTTRGDIRIGPLDLQPLFVPQTGAEPAFIGHMSAVTRITFDASGRLVGTGSLDGRVRVWETITGAPRDFFASHADGAVHDLVFSTDGLYLVSASRRSVMVTQAGTGEVLARLRIQSEHPELVLDAEGDVVYIGGDHDGVTRWAWRTGDKRTIVGFRHRVRKLAITPDGGMLATAGADRLITLWDTASGKARRNTLKMPGAVDALWFTSGHHNLVVQSGSWVDEMKVEAAGLAPAGARLLPDVPEVIQPLAAGDQLLMITQPYTARPLVRRISLNESWADPVDTPARDLLPVFEQRLQLTINEWGEPQVLRSF